MSPHCRVPGKGVVVNQPWMAAMSFLFGHYIVKIQLHITYSLIYQQSPNPSPRKQWCSFHDRTITRSSRQAVPLFGHISHGWEIRGANKSSSLCLGFCVHFIVHRYAITLSQNSGIKHDGEKRDWKIILLLKIKVNTIPRQKFLLVSFLLSFLRSSFLTP